MREQLLPILGQFSKQRQSLIPILQRVQGELGYLPEAVVSEIAYFLGLSKNEVYGVASFYAQFRFTQPGKHMVKVCLGTACHVRGGQRILEAVERELDAKSGDTTKDGKFSLERVACFGCCALAPVMVVDDTVNAKMNIDKAKKILAGY